MRARPRSTPSFCVPKSELAENGYGLSLNRYKRVVHDEVDHVPPTQILAELSVLETEIQEGLRALEGMLS